MVLYDPTRAWVLRGLCRFVDPDSFFVSGGQPDRSPHPITQKAWDQAKLTCVRCPVLTECRRDTLGEEYGVYAGLDEHQRYRLRKKLAENERWKRWPEELRLEWGEHLAQLRAQGLTALAIRARTGLLPSVVDGLIAEWREHRAKQPEPDRKARPEGERLAPVAFPENPGQKHGWVRDGRRIADGWYAGHTSDGVWVRMHIPAGKGAAYKFFKAEDVKFYRPQPHYVVPYFGRPDAADSKEEAHAA
ncbi:WhiB family transcriptional regulator [Streptomyces sp. NPDC057235]|uniref:WhiB family transcriptional regulator n=1 Tax=Streptomyces sp. NPDC057235 TaxID=3346058 RepID=UPI003634A14D